jgi:hypothetical protein
MEAGKYLLRALLWMATDSDCVLLNAPSVDLADGHTAETPDSPTECHYFYTVLDAVCRHAAFLES